jgi:3'-phosphoadenosine 5'-phosphosulfate sulfotransferase
MQGVKLVDISRKKKQKQKEGTSETWVNELKTKSKNKNIKELYKGINDFKEGYQPKTW